MKILVIDDHRMFVDGLRFVVQQRNDEIALHHALNADECFALLEHGLEPDLILLDLNLPGANGLSILRQLQRCGVWAPVLIVSASQSTHDAQMALNQGALGFVPKSAEGGELLRAIDTVLTGEVYLPPQWSQLVPTGPEPEQQEERPAVSDRQMEVLHLLSQGHANKIIADQLKLSENTVKVHLREIFRALKVTNRTACVREAQRLGLA